MKNNSSSNNNENDIEICDNLINRLFKCKCGNQVFTIYPSKVYDPKSNISEYAPVALCVICNGATLVSHLVKNVVKEEEEEDKDFIAND